MDKGEVIEQLTEILKGEPWGLSKRLEAYIADIRKNAPKQRTSQQNRALHKWCELMATALNDAGYPLKAVLEHKTTDVDWSGPLVKEALWRPIQKAITGKTSTAELSKQEIDPIYETLNRHLGTHFHIHVPWPTYETPYDEAPLKTDK